MICDFLKEHGDYSNDKYFKELTTLRVGGHIGHFVMPHTKEDLVAVVDYLKKNSCSFKVLGNGSNIVCGDKEYEGVVINLKKIKDYRIENDVLYADAGLMVPMLAMVLAREGYSGLEFASGIPGNLGGLLFMNAGAYNHSISDVVLEVSVLIDGEIQVLKKEELEYGYRSSVFQKHTDWIILSCSIKLEKKDPKEIMDLMADRLARRKSTQPLELPSAGSCFRNPAEDSAWKFVDGIGYRGYKKGGISVSEKHPNFVVNSDNGKAEDYIAITDEIKTKVKEKYNIDLVMEVETFNC